MDPTFFECIEKLMTCITPIIVAWFGYRANKNEKQTKKYMEAQKELKEANDKLAIKDREDLQRKLNSISDSVDSMQTQITSLENKVADLNQMNRKIERLVEMSNANHEFSLSLSQLVLEIGNSLDTSAGISSGNLKAEMQRHQNAEREFNTRIGKIVY